MPLGLPVETSRRSKLIPAALVQSPGSPFLFCWASAAASGWSPCPAVQPVSIPAGPRYMTPISCGERKILVARLAEHAAGVASVGGHEAQIVHGQRSSGKKGDPAQPGPTGRHGRDRNARTRWSSRSRRPEALVDRREVSGRRGAALDGRDRGLLRPLTGPESATVALAAACEPPHRVTVIFRLASTSGRPSSRAATVSFTGPRFSAFRRRLRALD